MVKVVGLAVVVSAVLDVVIVLAFMVMLRVSTSTVLFVPTWPPRAACKSSGRRKISHIISKQWSEEY